jgi:hypothetical protein
MFSLFGAAGQSLYNFADAWHTKQLSETTQSRGFWQKVAESKWSPVTVLTDEMYEEMLQENLIRVKTEIALIDEHIEALKSAEQKERKTTQDNR